MLCMIFDDYQAAFFVLLYEKKLEGNYYFQRIVTCLFLAYYRSSAPFIVRIYLRPQFTCNKFRYLPKFNVCFRYLWLHKTDVRHNVSICLNLEHAICSVVDFEPIENVIECFCLCFYWIFECTVQYALNQYHTLFMYYVNECWFNRWFTATQRNISSLFASSDGERASESERGREKESEYANDIA